MSPIADTPAGPLAWAERGDGDPILLIAGTGYPGATWSPALVEPLAARHRVITYDHPGTGRTPARPGRYSTRGFAADAVAVLDAAGVDAAHVVGHSMGGRVAQWVALDRPERVRSLILAASGPGEFRADRPVTRGIPIHTARDMIGLGYEGYMRDHIARTFFTPEFVAARPAEVDWLVRAFWDARPTLEEYLRHIVARQEHQTADRLADIDRPTLVLVGDRDTHAGGTGVHWEQSAYLLEHIRGAERAVIEGAAHGYFWQCPEESVRILLDWAARH
ncbi:MAG TPA: alpha/beta fold hydrolase [Candidatus Limnocylindrales bacterium]|nr:alpha/beta fold hydrolase [Candidatus Limnocylindrales bacterium]